MTLKKLLGNVFHATFNFPFQMDTLCTKDIQTTLCTNRNKNPRLNIFLFRTETDIGGGREYGAKERKALEKSKCQTKLVRYAALGYQQWEVGWEHLGKRGGEICHAVIMSLLIRPFG